MVCHAIVVMITSVGLVLVHWSLHQYNRALHGIGHMYIGLGQHAALRVVLGAIELLSNSFRAVSLSLRLVCNAVAGHVLLAVLVEMSLVAVHSPLEVPPRTLSNTGGDMPAIL